MKTWWQGMVPREQALVAIAGGLTVLVICWQFLFVPLRDAHAAAKRDMQASAQTLTVLQEAYQVQRIGGAVATSNANILTPDAFKAAVTQLATEKGLSISRLQTGRADGVGIIFEDTDPRLVFFWINDIETRLGGRVSRLTMEQAGQTGVRVNVEIEAPTS